MLGVGLEYLVVLGGLAVMIQKWPVKSKVDLQDRKMFEILFNAVNGEHFLGERFSGNDFGAFGNSAQVAVLGVNLPDPAGIPITGRTDEELGMNIAEMESFQTIW